MSGAGGRGAGEHRRRGDAGVTLVEFMVAMMIFTVVVAVFMGGLVIMTRSTATAQAVAEAGDDVRLAFQRMDKQVRYASAINRPGPGASGAIYVEFRTTAVPAGDDPFCTQWRYVPAQGLLQWRSWEDVGSAAPGAWSTLIDDVRNPSDKAPFTFVAADSERLHQRLGIHLLVGPYDRAGAESQTTFVARNSSMSSSTNADDSPADGQSDTKVCISSGGRP